jgi:hypothetical protein
MRLYVMSKQAHLCDARNQQITLSRYRRNWKKEKAITRGGLGLDSVF